MEGWSRTRLRAVQLIFLACAFLGLAPAAATYGAETGSQPPAQPPVLGVQRDKDKTVYTIGARPWDTRRDDTDRAWDMLNNVVIDARGAHGKGPNNNR
jgi:hypothetical protein